MRFYSSSNFAPDSSIGYLARRIHQIGQGALDPVFADEGLTAIQWSTLVSIWFERGNTCAELARDLGHDKGAMTRLVDQMEARGWVTRERDAADRRVVNLRLTGEGEAVAIRCKTRVIECWNGWLEGWEPGEVDTLIGLMQKMRVTLDRATAEGRFA